MFGRHVKSAPTAWWTIVRVSYNSQKRLITNSGKIVTALIVLCNTYDVVFSYHQSFLLLIGNNRVRNLPADRTVLEIT